MSVAQNVPLADRSDFVHRVETKHFRVPALVSFTMVVVFGILPPSSFHKPPR
jgi:hypothetical protein